MTSILIIDDEQGIRSSLASILEDEKYYVVSAEDAVKGLEILEKESVNLVFLDVLLPNMGGLEALERIKREKPDLEVVMISGHANVDMAVRAVKLGAFDFLEKPLSLDKVLTVVRNALVIQKLKEENTDLRKHTRLPDGEIIGTSAAVAGVKAVIKQAASSDARILITGENGTGKELVARAVHRSSSRAGRAFVEVNCAAIPDTLIESELFGHEKGAFTDAVSSRKGRFELASGGTIFLDEIGDMSPNAQAKVLRVLQEQTLERVGGEKTITVDVRVVAATNKDLEAECAAGRFRRDLFFRLNVIPINLPPLRSRTEDIPLLLSHFLKELGAERMDFSPEITNFLSSYEWPGNVRELKNLAERIALMYDGSGVEAIKRLLNQGSSEGRPKQAESGVQKALPQAILELNYNDAKNFFEKAYLEFKFFQNRYIISKTAESIGIYPSNLHAKLRKYGINAPD